MIEEQASPRLWTRITSCQLGNGYIFAGLCVVLVLINIQFFLKVRSSERRTSQSAFQRWTPLVRELDDGVNIWAKYNWPNTPIMAIILKPFMDITPRLLGAQLWIFAKMACTILSIYLIFLMLDRPKTPFPFWGKALTVILALRPIEGDMVHGNVNLFILFTVVLAIYAFSRGWDILAGLSLALGIACKITPALFLPYLVWKRAWKTLAATMVGLGLWLFLVPGAYFGWQNNLNYLKSWVDGMVMPYVAKNEITSEHQNQSLPGVLERFLRDRPSISRPNDDKNDYVTLAKHNFADLSPATIGGIVKGLMGIFCLAVIWRCRAPRHDRTDWRWVAEFGIVVLGMLIFSERTWKHHAVTLLIPFAVIAHQLSAFQLPPSRRWYLTGTLGFVVLLMLTTSSGIVTIFGVDDSRDVFGKHAQVYGAYLWAFLLLLIAMFTLAGQRVNDPPAIGLRDRTLPESGSKLGGI